MAGQKLTEAETHQGNSYVLLMGLPRPKAPLTLAPGLTLVPFESPLSVFDLAAAAPLASANGRCWNQSRCVHVRD